MLPHHRPIKKIVVVGTSGCGKTTLGKRLAELSGSPFTDLDDIYWLPGWIERPEEEMQEMVKQLSNKDRWVIAGNYSRGASHTWPKADLIIWLDYQLPVLVWRALKRSIRRIVTKEPCCNGNTENISRLFSRNSILAWILTSYRRRKKTFNNILNDPEYKQFIRISSRAEKEKLIAEIQSRF